VVVVLQQQLVAVSSLRVAKVPPQAVVLSSLEVGTLVYMAPVVLCWLALETPRQETQDPFPYAPEMPLKVLVEISLFPSELLLKECRRMVQMGATFFWLLVRPLIGDRAAVWLQFLAGSAAVPVNGMAGMEALL